MKKLSIFIIFVLLGLFSTVYAQQLVQSGKIAASNESVPGYTLDKNTGERTINIDVTFLTPFDTKPEVVLSITAIDAEKSENLRYSIEAKSVSRDGFTVKITTWGNSKIYGINANWLAHSK